MAVETPNFGYYKIDLSNLPSRGLLYPRNAIVRFRPLTVGEVKFIASLREDNCKDMLDMILRRCVRVENMDYLDLLYMDRSTLLFTLRDNTFITSESAFSLKYRCPYCHKEHKLEFGSSDLSCKSMPNLDIYTDEGDVVERITDAVSISSLSHSIERRYPKIEEELLDTEYPDFDMILNFTNLSEVAPGEIGEVDVESWLEDIPAIDYIKLLNFAREGTYGVMSIEKTKCRGCEQDLNLDLVIDEYKIFSNVQLREIIRTIVEITKYSGIYISDDMLNPEFEIIANIVQKMINTELEEMNKSASSSSSLPKGLPSMSSLTSLAKRRF